MSDLNPVEVCEQLKAMIESLSVVHISALSPSLAEQDQSRNDRALFLFRTFLYYRLTSKKIILGYKLDRRAFSFLLQEIQNTLKKSLINPGEMSGSIAAQSLGETLT